MTFEDDSWSLEDIYEARRRLGREVHCAVYMCEEENKVIVVPRYDCLDGMSIEQETPLILPFDGSPDELGLRVMQALRACKAWKRTLSGIRGGKLTDSHSFRASKAKSVKQFRRKYVYVEVRTVNANLLLTCDLMEGSDGLFLGSYLAPGAYRSRLGELLHRMYRLSPCLQTSSA